MNLSILAIVISVILGLISILVYAGKIGGKNKSLDDLVEKHKIDPLPALNVTLAEMKGNIDRLLEIHRLCSIQKLELAIVGLQKDSETFWRVIGPTIAAAGHSPTHHDRDKLMDKLFNTNDIEFDELMELVPMLDEAINNGDKPAKLVFGMAKARVTMLLSRGEK